MLKLINDNLKKKNKKDQIWCCLYLLIIIYNHIYACIIQKMWIIEKLTYNRKNKREDIIIVFTFEINSINILVPIFYTFLYDNKDATISHKMSYIFVFLFIVQFNHIEFSIYISF